MPSSQSERAGESLVTVLVAISTNVAMLLAKGVAAAITGSPALFAETLHSLADTANELLLLHGLRRSRRPADLRHPYGYGEEMYFWSLLAGLGVFLAGGVLSIWNGVQRLLSPGEVTAFILGYIVLGVGFFVDATSWVVSLNQLMREAWARRVSLFRHVRTTTDTTVTAVFREDGASMLGGLIAFTGLGLHQITRSAVPDAMAALIIGAMLAFIGLRIVQRNRELLTNRGESAVVVQRIRNLLSANPQVAAVGRVATMYVGPHQLLATVEIQPVEELSGRQLRELITNLRSQIVASIPRTFDVYITPAVAVSAEAEPGPFDPDYWLHRFPDEEQT